MYAFLTGTIDEKDENLLIINVGGVGYEVLASSHTVNSVNQGEIATIYTYLHVRENPNSIIASSLTCKYV